MPVAEGDDLVAFHLLVPAEADVVTALLRRRRGAIAMDDRDVERSSRWASTPNRKDGVNAAISLPPPEGTIDPRVVDFRTTFAIPFDR